MRIFHNNLLATLLAPLMIGACPSAVMLGEAQPDVKKGTKAIKPEFHERMAVRIPILAGHGFINADVYRPQKKSSPMTIVLIAPGSGNVSRRGEATGDGVGTYGSAIGLSELWARSLSDHGFFVLSYDKRTCRQSTNPLCDSNDQVEVDRDGIAALARDLERVLQFLYEKIDEVDETARLVILTSTQGAQVISVADLGEVSGIALLSPITTDLPDMWISGLGRAAAIAKGPAKNRLLNQRESMDGFFKSLDLGKFDDSASVRGASIRFWRSWIEASKNTLPRLIAKGLPTLMMFSPKDPFSPEDLIKDAKNKVRGSAIAVISSPAGDRNFVAGNGLLPEAVGEVIRFIETLPAVTRRKSLSMKWPLPFSNRPCLPGIKCL